MLLSSLNFFQRFTHYYMLHNNIIFNGQSYVFVWPNEIERIPTIWYSICILLNTEARSMEMFINGVQSPSKIKLKYSAVELKSPIQLGNCQNSVKSPFSGQITDLGIWNRALSFEEVQEFSLNCNSKVVKHIHKSNKEWGKNCSFQ